MTPAQSEIRALRQALRDFDERLTEMEIRIEAAFEPPADHPGIKASPQLTALYAILHRAWQRNPKGVMRKETLHTALYGTAERPQKVIDVWLCKLRRALPPGERLETVWGECVRLVVERPAGA